MKPTLNFFSEEELKTVHNKALEILEENGMQIASEEALDILEEAGAEIEEENIVKIPRKLVNEAVESVPKKDELTLYGRTEENDIDLSQDGPVLAGMVQATQLIDLESREKRPATKEDLAQVMQTLEKLDHVSIASPLVTPQDISEPTIDWYTWATSLKNTSKHITGPATNGKCVRDAIKMASTIVGGEEEFYERPFISFWVLTRPPLHVDGLALDALMEASRHEVPAVVSSGPILGVTSPVTLTGAASLAHAEILACLVVSQLVNSGAPFIYTSFLRSMDMKVANVAMSSPEFAMLKSCMAELGHSLDLPTRMPSMLRDAKVLDAQAGFEAGMVGTVGAFTSDIIGGLQLDMDIVIDYADMIFCNEAMSQIKRMTRGVKTTENDLAQDLIAEVGHGGNYLKTSHTASNFQQSIWQPDLTERRMWEDWENDGALEMKEKALNKARKLVKEEPESVLEEDLQEKIDNIAKTATIDE